MKLFRRPIALGFIVILALGLRLYKLGKVPISLHGDEVGVGYNAYSLLKTGRDEYGISWPISLRADIPPLNTYITLVSIAVLGKTDFAIRLPSVLYGISGVVLTYLLARELFSKKIALFASLFLAVSPWHVQASRISHEANLGLALQLAGTLFFLKGLKEKRFFWVATVFWALSFYAYHGPRMTTPLLIVSLIFLFRSKLKKHYLKTLINSNVLLALLVFPVVWLLVNQPFTQNRLAGINIFIRDVTLGLARQEAKADNNQLVASVFHNPVLVYALTFSRQYFNYLNLDYLLFDSSELRYFNVSNVGLLYLWDFPFLIFGIYRLLKSRRRYDKVPLLWMAIAPLPAALTLGTPNPGRSFMLLSMLQVTTAVGVVAFLDSVRRNYKKYLSGIAATLSLLFLSSVLFFLHQYFIHSRHEFAKQWEYGVKEAAEYIAPLEGSVDAIIFTNAYKEPYIYVLFYGNKDPEWLGQVSRKKRHHFIGYQAFGKYEFRPIDWQVDQTLNNVLLVGTPEEIPADEPGLLKEIRSLDDSVVLRIVKV